MKKIICLFFFVSAMFVKAQIAGSFSVPINFPTIAAAITTLNLQGVAGAVTINVPAGYTETAPLGGFMLFNPVGASATNSVVFQRYGTGPNPLITAYTGTASPGTILQDGVWRFIGADYITVDGIDIIDLATTGNIPAMEFGYGFFRQDAANGCQNNTIKNCTVTLYPNFSSAILVLSSSYTVNNIVLPTTSTAGANSYNKFYHNKFSGCKECVSLKGVPSTMVDEQNDVGGMLATTGNTINFGYTGGGGTGVNVVDQYSINVSNNVISNGTYTYTGSHAVYAIRTGTALNTDVSIQNNTITLSSNNNSSSSFLSGIINDAGDNPAASSYSINISGNVFPSYNFSTITSGLVYYKFIYSSPSSPNVNISNNLISNATIGYGFPIIIFGSTNSVSTVNSNTITNVTMNDGAMTVIGMNGTSQTFSNNLISNLSTTNTSGGRIDAIYSDYYTTSAISGNTITNVTSLSPRLIHSICNSSTSSALVSGNNIGNIKIPVGYATPFGSNTRGISIVSANNPPVGSGTITGNTIYSLTCNATTSASVLDYITGITCSALNNLVSKNKIYSLNSNANVRIVGIGQAPNTNADITNNIIGDLRATSSSETLACVSHSSGTNSTALIAYNSIFMNNAVNTGFNAGSSVLWLDGGGTYGLNNNIFINSSLPTGSAVSTIIRSNSSSLLNLSTSSNQNLYYIGPPQFNTAIYFDGLNTYSTLPVFKQAATPREANSVTEFPPFISTVGTSPNALNILANIPTQVEGGAAPLSGYTTDYAGTARNTVTPDIGAWEGNFIKADNTEPLILSSGFTGPSCNTTNRTFTASIKDTSGVATGILAPRLYYKINFGLYTSVPGVLVSGTATLGIWSFNISYAASLGDVIYYFIVAQDASNLSNLLISPLNNAVGSTVNNISIAPIPALNYTIETYPTIAVNNGSICAGSIYTLSPSGAATYSYSGGSATVSPLTNTNYSITGQSAGGCLSTNTVVASINVLATPSVSVNGGSICIGQSFTLSPTGAISYTYSSGSAIVSPITTTSYSIIGSNSFGCISLQSVASVIVNTGSITANGSSNTVCAKEPVTLSGGGASSYTWTGGVINNSPFVPVQSSMYTVSGIGIDGCLGTATINISVMPLPTIQITPGSAIICSGEEIIFTASGAQSYTWNPGGITNANLQISPVSSGQYTVTGLGSNGCKDSNTATLTISICDNLADLQADKTFLMFPNPSSGLTKIRNYSPQALLVSVHNTLGQTVMESTLETSGDLEFNLSTGIYLISIFDGKNLYKEKLIITRD